MISSELPPTLRLTIDTTRPVLARQAGHIIDRLAISFEHYQRRAYPELRKRSELRLENLSAGSLIADLLAVADSLVTLHENRDILGGFVAQLGDVLAAMRGMSQARPDPTHRKTIEALAAPVASDGARLVSVQVIGDNNNIVVIDGLATEGVIQYARQYDPRPMPEIQRRLEERLPAADAAAQELEPDANLEHAQPIRVPYVSSPAPSGDAALLFVDGQWYARPEGLSGVLLPVPKDHGSVRGLDVSTAHVAHGRLVAERGRYISFEPQIVAQTRTPRA